MNEHRHRYDVSAVWKENRFIDWDHASFSPKLSVLTSHQTPTVRNTERCFQHSGSHVGGLQLTAGHIPSMCDLVVLTEFKRRFTA